MVYSETQNNLESLIIQYQNVNKESNTSRSQRIYNRICDIYNPLDYINVWHNKYGYLFDTYDDFMQDYQFKFCEVLLGWKPVYKRTNRVVKGGGAFKNYFWGALHNHYTNIIQYKNTGKKSLAIKCSVCETWHNTIVTHVITEHLGIIMPKMFDVNVVHESCPVCLSYHFKKNNNINFSDQLLKHLRQSHKHQCFDIFIQMYPECNVVNPKMISIECGDADDGDGKSSVNIYDITPSGSCMDDFLNLDFSDVEKKIINEITLGKSKNVKYNKNIHNCSKIEFKDAIDSIKHKIYISGMDKTHSL